VSSKHEIRLVRKIENVYRFKTERQFALTIDIYPYGSGGPRRAGLGVSEERVPSLCVEGAIDKLKPRVFGQAFLV